MWQSQLNLTGCDDIGSNSEDHEISGEGPIEAVSDVSAMRYDPARPSSSLFITVRAGRRRNVAFKHRILEDARESALHCLRQALFSGREGGDALQTAGFSSQRNFRRVLRSVMFIAIQVVFIVLLVFLWMKISAKVNE